MAEMDGRAEMSGPKHKHTQKPIVDAMERFEWLMGRRTCECGVRGYASHGRRKAGRTQKIFWLNDEGKKA